MSRRGVLAARAAGLRLAETLPIMSIWASSVPSLWAAYWAAIFAQLAHLRTLEDGVGAAAFSWIARSLLAAGLILFVLAK